MKKPRLKKCKTAECRTLTHPAFGYCARCTAQRFDEKRDRQELQLQRLRSFWLPAKFLEPKEGIDHA